MTEAYEDRARRGGADAVREASRFFTGEDAVHVALRKVAHRLDEARIAYVVVGGMALNAHGYRRTTVDVDVLVTAEGLDRVKAALTGLGYLPPFEHSRQLRDTETGVRIEFLVSGGFPGDGKPKPITFPDPVEAGVLIDGIRYVGLERLLEMKLASGMSHPGRLKDLADVQELIKIKGLPLTLAADLHPHVRAEYERLWHGAHGSS